jgi:2-polyprenyl-3-methyl-5-hydroxy-6-metoxy-1,4-benzoquinol methylase
MELTINNLPFYYRLKSDEDVKFEIPENYPFQFDFDNFGLLTQRRNPELLNLLEKVYSLDYNIGYIQDGYEIAEPYVEDFWAFLLTQVQGFGKSLRILEIGCGAAILLHRLKQLGHTVIGIDPSPLAERAGKKYGITIHNSMLHENLEIGDFDLIYSMDVLEHAFLPEKFLKVSANFLKPGGKVMVSVPDAGPSIKIGDISCAMHQHLQYFDSDSLKQILKRAKLSDVKIQTSGYGGSLYGVGVKSTLQMQAESESQDDSKLDPNNSELVRMKDNSINVIKKISEELSKGKSIGIYAPLRALPYLADIPDGLNDPSIKFIDDTKLWQKKRFDGSSIPIENFSSLLDSKIDTIMIFSLTFEKVLYEKIKKAGIGSQVITLSEMLMIEKI